MEVPSLVTQTYQGQLCMLSSLGKIVQAATSKLAQSESEGVTPSSIFKESTLLKAGPGQVKNVCDLLYLTTWTYPVPLCS